MIHMLVGIQGAGKTTFAKELATVLNCRIVSTDNVRKNNPGILEAKVWPQVYEDCADALKKGEDAIFDATNITPKVRKRFFDEVSMLGITPTIGVYFFDTDLQTCCKRVEHRNNLEGELFLPLEVIPSFSSKLIVPTLDEGFAFIKIIKNGEVIRELRPNY